MSKAGKATNKNHMIKTPFEKKSSIQAIKDRFDNDVERFSNLETGQQAIIDAPWMLELIAKVSARVVPHAEHFLDIGCGAGNNTIKVVREHNNLNCDLVDLSLPMLERARERLKNENTGDIRIFQGDFRCIKLPPGKYDIIVAAAVLHHLRDEQDWLTGFSQLFSLLKPSGALFVSDLFFHENEAVHSQMWDFYGEYLQNHGGEEYRNKVFEYIDYEDTPRSITFQIELLKNVGFKQIDVLHKNICFGVYMATR